MFAWVTVGYADTMSDAPLTKPGPADPQGLGVDAQTPPGGPQRQDRAEAGLPGGRHDDVSGSPGANKSAAESGGGTIPLEDEQPDPRPDGAQHAQQENAGTSLDQPSGSASEG